MSNEQDWSVTRSMMGISVSATGPLSAEQADVMAEELRRLAATHRREIAAVLVERHGVHSLNRWQQVRLMIGAVHKLFDTKKWPSDVCHAIDLIENWLRGVDVDEEDLDIATLNVERFMIPDRDDGLRQLIVDALEAIDAPIADAYSVATGRLNDVLAELVAKVRDLEIPPKWIAKHGDEYNKTEKSE